MEAPRNGGLRACLDHVIVMLDDEAYRDLHASELLRHQLGRFKVKQATSTLAGTYTSTALAGVNTLLEFFHVAAPPLPGVTGGLVFSFEAPGSMPEVRRRLEERGATEIHYQFVERAVDGSEEKKPWYHLVRPDFGEKSPFLAMLAEVTPEYFASIGASPGPAGELCRRSYLDAALGGAPSPEHYLRDVTEAMLNLNEERASRLAATLEALGFTSETEPGTRVLRGPDVTLRLVSRDGVPEGVLEVRTSLQRPKEGPREYRLGRSARIDFGHSGDEGSAVWTFTPPKAVSQEA